MNKPKVLLIQRYVPHYRIPIYERLSEQVNLTILYSDESVQGEKDYSHLKMFKKGLYKVPKIGYFYACNFAKMANQYDVIITSLDPSFQSVQHYMRKRNRRCKVISWGIGVLADREHQYDCDSSRDPMFLSCINYSDAALFYCDYPVKKYVSMGVAPAKLFIANNTVYEPFAPYSSASRDRIVFLGSLYKVKRVDELVRQYSGALQKTETLPPLYIIGDGEMRRALTLLIDELNLSQKVILTGEVSDPIKLRTYLDHAIACISPNQAGLSVLQSMSCGVPFITLKNAITGGEIFNIHNGENGILFDKFEDLKDILCQIGENTEQFLLMGKNAHEYYWNNRTCDLMVDGFMNAIQYVLKWQ